MFSVSRKNTGLFIIFAIISYRALYCLPTHQACCLNSYQITIMAEVVEIIQRLQYEANADVITAINAEFGTQINQLNQLKQKEQEYSRLLAQTSADQIRQRRVLESLLERNRRQYNAITESIGRQFAANQNLNRSLQQTTRNLGGLTMAGSQLLREAPAFTFSIQTGILALSNNIPILLDQLQQAQRQGANTREIFRALGSSIFGLTGIITIAVSVLTIFGDKLFSSAKGAEEQKKSIDDATSAIDKYAKVLQNASEFNDEGVNAAKRNLESIKAQAEGEENAFKRSQMIYNAERELRAKERTELENRIKLYKQVKVALQTGRGSDAQQARRFAQSISGFSKEDQDTFNAAYKSGQLNNRLLSERIKLLEQEQKALSESDAAFEESFRNKRIAALTEFGRKLNEIIEDNEIGFLKLRAKRGLGELEEIQRINQLELQEEELQLDRQIGEAERAGNLTNETQQQFDDIRLQLRRTANEKLLQESIKFFDKEKEEFEKFISEFSKLLDDGLTDTPKKVDADLDGVNRDIKKTISNQDKVVAERKRAAIDAYDAVRDAVFGTLQQIYDFEAAMVDREIALYQRRVDTAVVLAERGNTELLRIEQERLDKAQIERERIGQKQIQLNQLITISEQAKNVAQAISAVISQASGDPYTLAFRVIAAAAAIGAAVATVSSTVRAANNGFETGGYTGDMGTKQVAGHVHGREFVFNAPTTAKYRPEFDAIHAGANPYMVFASPKPYSQQAAQDNKKMDELIDAVNSNAVTNKFSINDSGIYSITERHRKFNRRRFGH